MGRVSRSVLVEREMTMLLLFEGEASSRGRPFVQLSLRAICRALDLKESQVRLTLKTLAAKGLLRIEPRVLPNGGTAENAYRITPKGANALAARRGMEHVVGNQSAEHLPQRLHKSE